MISLLQKMLQLYAAKALCQDSGPKSPIDEVISADEEQWEQVIRQLLQSDTITENAFLEDLQKRMESTVLGQSSGSYTQRVQVSSDASHYCINCDPSLRIWSWSLLSIACPPIEAFLQQCFLSLPGSLC